MPQETIPSASQMSSYDHHPPARPAQPLPPPSHMITTAALHARMSLPSLTVQPPTGNPNVLSPSQIQTQTQTQTQTQSQRDNHYHHQRYETVLTPREEVHSPISSSPDSPQAVISTTTTPVVPRSAINTQRNPFPSSPSIAAAGSKRTASGTLKPIPAHNNSSASVPSSPAPPATPSRFVRSQSSVDLSPRNVAQLSSQLRTRLTYAFFKVQNNWTTDTLEQVEARISAGHHPTSPTSRVRVKREPSISEENLDHIRRHQRTASEPGTAHPLSNSIAADGNSGRTYESFWKEHEPNPIAKKILQAKAASKALGSTTNSPASSFTSANSTQSQSHSHGNLQPPVQIIRDRRTPYNPNRPIPSLAYHSQSTVSNASTISMVPNTPPPAPSHNANTQRTMEQDAVESLMFLSSPGNSQHFPSAHSIHNSSIAPSRPPMPQNAHLAAASAKSPSGGPRSPGRLPPPHSPGYSSPRLQQHHEPHTHYNYARNATTWPRARRPYKHARTSLSSLGMMGEVREDSGVGFDEELTDEETPGQNQQVESSYASSKSEKVRRVEGSSTAGGHSHQPQRQYDDHSNDKYENRAAPIQSRNIQGPSDGVEGVITPRNRDGGRHHLHIPPPTGYMK